MVASKKARVRPAGVGPGAVWNAKRRRWEEIEFWFDEAAAEKAVAFFADYLCFTKGEWSGRPFLLEGWQADRIIRPLFGWKRMDEALADPDVKAVVLDVDSPGGTISGVGELAADLRGMRGEKPIVAHADYLVASAAYWIASQADEIIAAPSALIGSVGVYTMHVDQSGYLEQLGIKIQFVAEPAEKIEGNSFEPLGEAAEAHMRGIVAQGLKAFRGDIAAGRPGAKVTDEWARVYTAADAKAMGMVDKIRTLPETLAAYGVDRARDQVAQRQRAQALRQAQLSAATAELESLGVRV
jgi:signal peptide peptidase SppA